MPDAPSPLPSPTWCVLPWVHAFADERGHVRPCCMALESANGELRDEQGAPISITGQGLDNAWNSVSMRSLRLGMLRGEKADLCSRCFRDEDLGIRSYRQMSNHLFAAHLPVAAQTGADGSSDTELIRSLDLRLGNLCNLRCRMCSPISSKGLIGEYASLHGVPLDDPRFVELRDLDWIADPAVWQSFEKHLPHLERLHFGGGEPMLVEEMFRFLERIVASGFAGRITLSYVSNLTVLPRRIFDLWPHFKRVSVAVSLDGAGAVNSFIRHPSKWETIDRNIRVLNDQAEALNCRQGLTLNTTVQAYNIFSLDALMDYSAGLSQFDRPKLSILHYPEHFSARILPLELKQKAAAKLRAYANTRAGKWPAHWSEADCRDLLSTIEGLIDYMLGGDRTELLPEFKRWNAHMDTVRGQRSTDVFPEIASLL